MRIDIKKAKQKGYHVEVSDDTIDIYPDMSTPIIPAGLFGRIVEHLSGHTSLDLYEAERETEHFAATVAKAHMVKDLID